MVPFDEGRAWVGVNRELAVAAWNECLRRSSGAERNEFYRLILGTSYSDPRLREEALRLSDTDAQLAMTALRSGYADSTTLEFLEEGKSTLGPDQLDPAIAGTMARGAGNSRSPDPRPQLSGLFMADEGRNSRLPERVASSLGGHQRVDAVGSRKSRNRES